MSNKLTADQAVKILRENDYIVTKEGNKYRVDMPKFPKDNSDIYTAREIIKMANNMMGVSGFRRKYLKHFNNRQNRSETKKKLHEQQYDDFSDKKQIKPDNWWNWD